MRTQTSHDSIRHAVATDVASRWRLLLYPRLREMPVGARDDALRAARQTELDMLERIGILGGLIGATAILQTVGADWNSLLVRYIIQFALALPLLGFLIGPFLLRRTRRGLDIVCRTEGTSDE